MCICENKGSTCKVHLYFFIELTPGVCSGTFTVNSVFSLCAVGNERTVVNKERAGGYYRLSAYYFAKMVSELPLVILQPTLFLTIVYWMGGLNKSVAFLGSLFLLLLTTLAGQVGRSQSVLHQR